MKQVEGLSSTVIVLFVNSAMLGILQKDLCVIYVVVQQKGTKSMPNKSQALRK